MNPGASVFLSLQCSRSCGGGFQRRQVLCKQRLADGSILELPDTFCPSKSPTNQQPCAEQECPPQWVTTDWSQVGFPHCTNLPFESKSKFKNVKYTGSAHFHIPQYNLLPVFSDLWKWHSETTGSLQKTRGRWGTVDRRPWELFPDCPAHQNPAMLPQALWQ